MSGDFYPYETLHDKGLAVGFSSIKDDTITLIYRGEQWTFPSEKAHPLVTYNGYFYTAPIEKVRELVKGT